MNLNKQEIQYYHRHLVLPQIGKTGQQALKKAKVLVIGAGGLGCPVLIYLSGAGVGRIGIVDADKVAVSNLHRQVLYGFSQVGEFKAEAAVNRLKDLNPNIVLKAYTQSLSSKNAVDLVSQYDVIVDATDNFPSRYLINDICVYLNKPFVSGAIDCFQGQVSVLNFTDAQGNKYSTYRCLFPKPPAPETAPDCSQNGVIGVLPGIIGNFQANEVIKMICGVGEVLSGKVLMFNALSNQMMQFSIQRNEQAVQQALQNAPNFELFDYEFFCSSNQKKINEISVVDLHQKLQNNEKIQLMDIRSTPEFQEELPNAVRISVKDLQTNIHEILGNSSQVVIYCDHGTSSARAIRMLPNHHNLKNIFNLTGGLAAWLKEEKK
jgi:molybdopterin/thiamine biosynthesis adenylyltransferase/rhodanese-related sulfurtransferase